MVGGVLRLAERNVRSIMTLCSNISWVDVDDDGDANRHKLLAAPHGMYPVCQGSLDQVLGVARAKDLLGAIAQEGRLAPNGTLRQPVRARDHAGHRRGLVRGAETYSLAGHLLRVFGQQPARGATTVHQGYRFTVEEADAQRIRSIVVERLDDGRFAQAA